MTTLCKNGDGNPTLRNRRVCLACYLARQRELAQMTGRKPHEKVEDMTMDEFEQQFEPPTDSRRRVER